VRDFATAVALVLVIEGVLYALLPAVMQQINAQVSTLPAPFLRATGLAAACLGVGAVWLIRG